MKKSMPLFVFVLLIPVSILPQQRTGTEKDKILAVLFAQRDAWNKGDIEEYMAGYWKSDSLKFIGKSGITYGWQKTLENYKKGYPDEAAMGKLEFTVVELNVINSTNAFMIGKWKLAREKDTPAGHFTLFWKKIDGAWKVIADHSS
jgi:ketosteroid isomerase-like protein